MANRFIENPLITAGDISPSQSNFIIECVMNPSAFKFDNKTWLLLRVAERPKQKNGTISIPVMDHVGGYDILSFDKSDPELDYSDPRKIQYQKKTILTTISHLRLVCSEDGIHFHEPKDEYSTILFGEGELESYGIEDCRVSFINGTYNLTYTQVSPHGVGVGLMRTKDWLHFDKKGMIFPPHNKDCAIFEEQINGKYYCFHRPSGVDVGGNFMWIATSENLTHWGEYVCVLHTRPDMWDSERVGAGAAPIKTEKGWLAIYHGANHESRYCLGAVLFDLEDPSKVIARCDKPILEPETTYELNGFFSNVVFTNGHVVDGDKITVYYGASDEVICGAVLSINDILADLVPV
jgi:predicted GH43/DUF377 family glycosyl hydrolase